jgi:ankyrin repeat protein
LVSLASSVAFSAAATGQQAVVKKFIDEYPIFKNKSSLWGTTLLYTAALNNQFEIVKYLVEKAHCAVNARNWRNIDIDQSSTTVNTLNPTPGSTALHGACSNDHLRIVEYLVREKNADYFIKNQAKKTPIEYGEQYSDIKKFFQDYLLISYSTSSSTNLPNKSITDEDRPQ